MEYAVREEPTMVTECCACGETLNLDQVAVASDGRMLCRCFECNTVHVLPQPAPRPVTDADLLERALRLARQQPAAVA
jgi:recombinational DNA repair protein (RecF pathway)